MTALDVEQIINDVQKKIDKTCKKIYRLLLLRGYARLDMRLTESGDIVFIEANPNPILSEWEDFVDQSDKIKEYEQRVWAVDTSTPNKAPKDETRILVTL